MTDAPTPPGMPDKPQIAAMERAAVDAAHELIRQGYTLAAPNRHLMARILITRVFTKAMVRIARDEGMLPATAVELIGRTMGPALQMAFKEGAEHDAKIAAAIASVTAGTH